MQMVPLLWKTFGQSFARAKEQARKSDAAASKAAEELKADKAAHCRSREEMAGMAVKLEDATDRYEVLERERQAEQEDRKKATAEAKMPVLQCGL